MSALASVLPELTADGAERLSARISIRLDTIADNYVAVMPLIREALNRNAHAVLGYTSPGAYIKDRFGDALGKLGAELRREVVKELSNAGLSTRAIAPVVGVSKSQVAVDIEVSSAGQVISDLSPAPIDVTPDLPPRDDDWTSGPVNPTTGEVLEDGAVVTEIHSVKVVTGLDGKSYPQTTKEPRRTALIDSARNAGWELRKAAERLERITTDDRYQKNKAEIVAALQPHLDFASEVIAGLESLPLSD